MTNTATRSGSSGEVIRGRWRPASRLAEQRSLRGQPAESAGERELRHLPRRLHSAGSGELRAQAQRGEPGEQSRRHQPQHEPELGVEGPTDAAHIVRLRERMKRNFLATLAFSQGVPMLSHGDELGRTQGQQQRVLPGQPPQLDQLAAHPQNRELPGVHPQSLRHRRRTPRSAAAHSSATSQGHRAWQRSDLDRAGWTENWRRRTGSDESQSCARHADSR